MPSVVICYYAGLESVLSNTSLGWGVSYYTECDYLSIPRRFVFFNQMREKSSSFYIQGNSLWSMVGWGIIKILRLKLIMLTYSVSETFSVTLYGEYSWHISPPLFFSPGNLTEHSSPPWIIDGFIAQVESSRPLDCRDNDAEAGAQKDTPKVISARHSNDLSERKRDVHMDYRSPSDCTGVKMGWRQVNGSRWWIDWELDRHSRAHRSPFKNDIISQESLKKDGSVAGVFFLTWLFFWVRESSGWWGFVAIFSSTTHPFPDL